MRDRIKLEMSVLDVIHALTDGNPGAIRVCVEIYTNYARIDPQAVMGGFAGLLALDTHRIYGSRIWLLYKDVCGKNLINMCGLLRAVQLGHISDKELQSAIDGHARIDIPAEMEFVRDWLAGFIRGDVLEDA